MFTNSFPEFYGKYTKPGELFKQKEPFCTKKLYFLKKNLEFGKMCVILHACSLELIKLKECKKWAT